MLNELLLVECGVRQARIEMAERHPAIKDARRMPSLHVKLDTHGRMASVSPISPEIAVWTLRDGQHNSFPFVQPKHPLWSLPDDDDRRQVLSDRTSTDRRRALLALAEK